MRCAIYGQHDGDCVSEAIGLALPYLAGAGIHTISGDKFCMLAGEMIMDLIVKQIRPRDIVTRKALEMRPRSSLRPAARPMLRCTTGDRA
jgi:dihydroxyacid dehydratase/phosphogluconate dehydratase